MENGKQLFVADLEIGQEVEAPFLVLSLSRGRTSRGGVYLNVELGDRSGRIQAKVWDEAEALAARLAEGTVALIRGYVDSYRGSPQFIIRAARPLKPEEFAWPDYLRAAPRPAAAMKAELWALVESLPDADYRRLVSAALSSPRVGEQFYLSPAAKSFHHAHLHGLLQHSLSVGQLAAGTAGHYPQLNPSLLVAGAILHDLGKIWEFSQPPKVDYTSLGRLKGHLAMGSEFLAEVAAELGDFPEDKLTLLQHLILSHHGEPEFGAPVRPQILEALVLHHLDNIDAKVEAIDAFLDQETDAEGWSPYHRLLGSYFLRTPDFPPSAPPEPDEAEPEQPLVETNEDSENPPEDEPDDDPSQSEGRLF